jgi:hypothetical protein
LNSGRHPTCHSSKEVYASLKKINNTPPDKKRVLRKSGKCVDQNEGRIKIKKKIVHTLAVFEFFLLIQKALELHTTGAEELKNALGGLFYALEVHYILYCMYSMYVAPQLFNLHHYIAPFQFNFSFIFPSCAWT